MTSHGDGMDVWLGDRRAGRLSREGRDLTFDYEPEYRDWVDATPLSLLLSGPDATLAPLYDLNSALPFTQPWGSRFASVRKLHSSFVLGSTDAFTRITEGDWRAALEGRRESSAFA